MLLCSLRVLDHTSPGQLSCIEKNRAMASISGADRQACKPSTDPCGALHKDTLAVERGPNVANHKTGMFVDKDEVTAKNVGTKGGSERRETDVRINEVGIKRGWTGYNNVLEQTTNKRYWKGVTCGGLTPKVGISIVDKSTRAGQLDAVAKELQRLQQENCFLHETAKVYTDRVTYMESLVLLCFKGKLQSLLPVLLAPSGRVQHRISTLATCVTRWSALDSCSTDMSDETAD